MRKLVGLIQARMGSLRLPGKVMMPLANIPLVEHIFNRITACAHIDTVLLATTQSPNNDKLVGHCRKLEWRFTAIKRKRYCLACIWRLNRLQRMQY